MEQKDCIFCQIIQGKIPSDIILETDFSIVIKDINPKAPIHYLIIPKKHIIDLRQLQPEDKELAADLLFVAQKLSKKMPASGDFKLVANNGAGVGQCVFHSHIHFLSGKKFVDI